MDIHVSPTRLDGVVVVDTDFVRDERGFFIESYNRRTYAEHGLRYDFVQDNHSRSRGGVLRGLHYQAEPAPMAKLVRCTAGRVLDVAVDIRAASPTLGQWVTVELSDENMRQFMIPAGFAHGFLTLTDSAEVQYKCTAYYEPDAEGSIAWDDADIGIEWPVTSPLLSARDRAAMSLARYLERPAFVYSQDAT